MLNRHLAPVVLTLLLGACSGGSASEPKASTATTAPEAAPVTTAVSDAAAPAIASAAPAPAAGSQATVRTDDLEAELRAVDQELGGTQQSVNQANDTSPARADG